MGRTVGRRWPHKTPNGGTDICAYCDARFPVTKLVRLRNGLLACVDNDAIGRDEIELDEANRAARYRTIGRRPQPL